MSETTSKVSSGGKGKATDPVPLPKDASTTVPAKPVDGQDDATKLEKKDGPAGKTKEGAEGLDDDDDEAPLEPPSDPDGIIDMEVLQQIRDMDDEEEDDDDPEAEPHGFSRGIVYGYFDQAKSTFADMEKHIASADLPGLSSLGHFLKGSSAALGVVKVQAACEKMQHYGLKRDEERNVDLSADEALAKIKALLMEAKREYRIAKAWLEKLYAE